MIEIKNLLFQPLTFHRSSDGRGLYLGPRQRRWIEDGEVSPEIELAARRGLVLLTPEALPPPPPEKTTRKRRKGGKG